MTTSQANQRLAYATQLAKLFPEQGAWTEEDYFALPDTNRIVELSDGRLIMPTPASDPHQKASIELALALKQHVDANDLGEVRYAPMSVRLWEGKIREPDVLFVRKEHSDRMGETVYGPPDWVAEIISRGTRKTDEVDKRAEYAQAGIPEYWLIDPQRKTIRVFVLREGKTAYTLAATCTPGQVARSETIEGFEVAVDKIVS